MRNVILAFSGILIAIYTFLLVMGIFSLEVRKNGLENHVAQVVEGILESAYQNGEEAVVRQRLIWELSQNIDDSAEVSVEIPVLDLQKGIIHVKVSETFRQFNGKMRTIACEKTVLMEQEFSEASNVTVRFMLNGRLYKEYQVQAGELCPTPKEPAGTFGGWLEEGAATQTPLREMTQVWEDKVYVAVTE